MPTIMGVVVTTTMAIVTIITTTIKTMGIPMVMPIIPVDFHP